MASDTPAEQRSFKGFYARLTLLTNQRIPVISASLVGAFSFIVLPETGVKLL